MDQLIEILTSQNFITSVVVILLCFALLRVLKKVYRSLHKDEINAPGMRDRIVPTSYKIVRWVIIAFTVLIVLQINGINLSSMFASLGVVSIIAGLALQDLFKDVIMGTHIMSHHFFEVGDIVKIGDFEGRIVDFNLQTTKLESVADLSIVTICNREITQATICSDVVDFRLPLSYDLKVEEVDSIMNDIIERAKDIEDLKRITFEGTDEFADSAIYYRMRLITPPAKRFAVQRKLRRIIQEVLEEHHTSIPYNHLDIHNC